jgi:hypothetical protein
MHTRAPHTSGTIKLRVHNHYKLFSPTVNWNDSLGYKLAKLITTELSNVLKLPNAYNIQNYSNINHNLRNTKIDENTKLCSFDIENMYTNIPITEVKT